MGQGSCESEERTQKRESDGGEELKDNNSSRERRKDGSSRRRRDDRKEEQHRRRRNDDDVSDGSEESDDESRRRRRHRRKHSSKDRRSRSSRHRRKKRRKRHSRRYSSSSSSSSSSSDSSTDDDRRSKKKSSQVVKKVVNKRLLEKLSARGETLEEREARRSQRRAARIAAEFGYTAEENPFHDPNLHETFVWKKKENSTSNNEEKTKGRKEKQEHTFQEIAKVRQRRVDREEHLEEMDRIKAEESKMKELEHYDEWAAKEEEFHLQQQRQRSAIRLVERRERPVDVLAKNLLLFGLSEDEKQNRAAVKYQEKYNAMDELETLEAELQEPHLFLQDLKLVELQELMQDVHAFCVLEERDSLGNNAEHSLVYQYWNALSVVVENEIMLCKIGKGDEKEVHLTKDIQKLFHSQSKNDLQEMQKDIETNKLSLENEDTTYWNKVLYELKVYLAKMELSDIHSKMLVRQLEKLERRKDALSKASQENSNVTTTTTRKEEEYHNENEENDGATAMVPKGIDPNIGNLEEELGISDEVLLQHKHSDQFGWQERYQPRKPRYFNRVKTGYDWNKYNQTHYDHDNPPPKIVQGYKFNVFYPDLIDKTQTPSYRLEAVPETNEFCIIRFSAGPPYEDIAFKIINREWNRSRKRGFRCTFERGVLSLYFNFASHWYRR